MTVARFRFYEELNEFIAPQHRRREFEYRCARAATVKNAIEAIGVPHTEVELIIANGESVNFAYRVRDGDRISVYPMFESFDIEPLLRVRTQPLRMPRFVADSHLGGLARLLRMLGLDTLYDNHYTDVAIRALAAADARTILTRDRDLLKCRDVTHGCYVHALKPPEQLREVVERLQLAGKARPFTLCLHCNLPLRPIEKAQVLDRLPPSVAANQNVFRYCSGCSRVYWPGDHYRRMNELLNGLVPAAMEEFAPSPSGRGQG
jgi:uncharacterized protein with PIN domain